MASFEEMGEFCIETCDLVYKKKLCEDGIIWFAVHTEIVNHALPWMGHVVSFTPTLTTAPPPTPQDTCTELGL